MKHLIAFLYKWVILTAVTAVFTMLLGALTFGQTLILSTIATVLLYPAGDLYVLPQFGNWTATVVDAVATAVIMWAVSTWSAIPDIAFLGALIIGLAVGVVEYFFHQYLQKEILPGEPLQNKP